MSKILTKTFHNSFIIERGGGGYTQSYSHQTLSGGTFMEQKRRAFSCFFQSILGAFLLTVLTGCLGSAGSALSSSRAPSSPSPISTSSQIVITMPPAVIGNVLVASNDEAPIIRNNLNQPTRLDKESEEAVIHFEGQNEE